MKNKTKKIKLLLLMIVSTLFLCSCSLSEVGIRNGSVILKETTLPETQPANDSIPESDNLTVHFLDVGQGLSILLTSNGHYMLYDGGDRYKSSFVVAYLKEQGITNLDYIIASHYDSDHINGVIGALNAFEIDTVIGPDYIHNSKTYESFINKVSELGKEVKHPAVGTEYTFGSATITILSPKTIAKNSNNNSVAIKVTNGNHAFVITGDAEHEEEADILASGIDLECDVLVAGHHGSASSTTWDLLQQTVPAYAIISCGEGNSYGHPHIETMEKFESMGIDVFRTDKQGTVIASSDGSILSWNIQPSKDYVNGESGSIFREQQEETERAAKETTTAQQKNASTYILNTNTKKIHISSCSSTKKMADKNYATSDSSIEQLEVEGYSKCEKCLK